MSGERVVTIIQSRVGSTRLPGKVLLPLGGRTVLERMLERVRSATRAGTVVVATTILPEDDQIARLCRDLKVLCFRGHPFDLLDRHIQTARSIGADHVVKVPSDCPLIDPDAIDLVVNYYLDHTVDLDYVSNLHPASYPDGNDVEIMSLAALEAAHAEATAQYEREHTTPFLWERPDRFRLGNVAWPTGRDCSLTHRYVLDYAEDYAVIRGVYETLSRTGPDFGCDAIVEFLDDLPVLAALNARYRGSGWYVPPREPSRGTVPLREGACPS
ncbi:MAG TPA: glycosyltransferase family protein [Gemmatimonadales bacterium]|nr:glycosyltransferase family protein [Gemmatimonadales bacterium]